MISGAMLNMENALSAIRTFAPERTSTSCRIFRLRSMATSSTTKQGEATRLASKFLNVLAAICSDKVESRLFDDLPGQAVGIHIGHERIGIHLLDIPHTGLGPFLLEHQLGADHCR